MRVRDRRTDSTRVLTAVRDLTRMLGIHISVAVAWQRASSGDWATYAAEVSKRHQRKET